MNIIQKIGGVIGVGLLLIATSVSASDNPLLDKYRAEGATIGIAGYAPYGYKQADGSFSGEQVELVRHGSIEDQPGRSHRVHRLRRLQRPVLSHRGPGDDHGA